MIHLFDKVYLAHESFMEGGHNIHISREVYENLGAKNENPYSMLSGATVKDALGDKTLLDMFKLLSNVDRKFYIYTDNEAFAKIITTWLKSATHMDSIAFNKFVDMYIHKYTAYYGKPYGDLKTALIDAWESAIEYDVTEGVSKNRSYEFLLASALHDRNFKYKDNLKKVLLHFYKREYEHILLEIKRDIDTHMFSDTIRNIFGQDIDSPEELKQSPKYNELFNRPMWKEFISYDLVDNTGYLPGTNSAIDITKATIGDVENMFDLYVAIKTSHSIASIFPIDLVDIDARKEEVVNICKEVILGEMSDELYHSTLDKIISEDLLMNTPYDLFQTILNLLLSHVKKLHKQNDPRLFHYTLK